MSSAGPAAALALKTQSKLSAADNDLAATAAAGQALNAAAAAAAAAAAPAAAAAAPARPAAYDFQAYMSAAGPAAALALKTLSRVSAGDNDLAGNAAAGQALWAQ